MRKAGVRKKEDKHAVRNARINKQDKKQYNKK
jgi:hypothetical protein